MVARNFSIQEIPYSRLLQIPDEENEFITLEELKPAIPSQGISHSYQPDYYDLPNLIENPCQASIGFQAVMPNPASSNMIEMQPAGNVASTPPVRRKRKVSLHESDGEDDTGEDAKSTKTNDENKKQNHSEIEKRRRDKMNTYITELSSMVPMCNAMSRKLDKLTVLRMAVQHLKNIRGAVHSYTEGHYKPSFLSDQELKHLILQAADGFLFVVGCDRGKILFVSESVSKVLHFAQNELLGQSLFDILHPKDVAKVKEQLSSSDLNPRERLIDAKTMLPVKRDVPQGASKLCPGARRSFFCRMKCRVVAQVKEEADTTTGCHRRNKQHHSDKKYNVIQCTGYLKSWSPTKIGLEEHDGDFDGESCNLSCLVAIGRILPHISTVASVIQARPDVESIQFVSRHTLDGKFLFVDQRATLVLGFLPQELLGASMYEYYHQEDIASLAESHKVALQNTDKVHTKIYRFKTKDGGFVRLQSEWKTFRNPWTKEIECLIAKNTLILTDFRTVESSATRQDGLSESCEYFNQAARSKDIHQIINSHVEASKIGRQIAEEIMDVSRRSGELSSESSPDPEASLPLSNMEISTSMQSDHSRQNSIVHDFGQTSQAYSIRDNVNLNHLASDSGGNTDNGIIEMIEDAVTESPNNVATDGNDEAAMAVIMSLLEADAGLGGPVDFSGLPWPLP